MTTNLGWTCAAPTPPSYWAWLAESGIEPGHQRLEAAHAGYMAGLSQSLDDNTLIPWLGSVNAQISFGAFTSPNPSPDLDIPTTQPQCKIWLPDQPYAVVAPTFTIAARSLYDLYNKTGYPSP